MEREPLDGIHEDESGGDHLLCKVAGVDALLLVLLELDAGVLQEVDRVLRVHVLGQVKLEVELPGGDALGQVALVVQERQTQLDDLEQVHVAPEQLVLVVSRRPELACKKWDDVVSLIILYFLTLYICTYYSTESIT